MSFAQIEEHRRLWQVKPVLPAVYAPWFEMLLNEAKEGSRVLEVGAGPGWLGECARRGRPDLRWVASDLHPAPWNALAADAARLPLRDASIDVVLGIDVLHHLARPGAFFAEAARVLRDSGGLALVEPWITPFSWPIYRLLHQESCRVRVDPWQPFPTEAKDSFEGDAAVPWRIVRGTPAGCWSHSAMSRRGCGSSTASHIS